MTFLKAMNKRMKKDRLGEVSAQLAYYLIFSFFPFLIFVLMLLSFTPLASSESLQEITSVLPKDTKTLIEPILIGLVKSKSATVLVLSLLLSLWSGSNGMGNLVSAIKDVFHVKNGENTILQRLKALLFTLAFALLIGLSLLTQVFGDQILKILPLGSLGTLLKSIVPLSFLTLGFSCFYYFGVGDRSCLRFKDSLFGGLFSAVLWSLMSFLFSLYVNHFGNYQNTYGSIGGIIILLTWLYLSAFVIMLGAEFIVVRRDLKDPISIPTETERPLEVIEKVRYDGASKRTIVIFTVLGTLVGWIIKSMLGGKHGK
ncbi:YihY/virulence factor BrkB family protein [Guggenheimella bovis]